MNDKIQPTLEEKISKFLFKFRVSRTVAYIEIPEDMLKMALLKFLKEELEESYNAGFYAGQVDIHSKF
jgi:hypothetical protein